MAGKIKKVMKIDGMTCGHCQARVEKALNAIDGVSAEVDLKKKLAKIELNSTDISDDTLRNAVTEAGYEPLAIEAKRGLFK